MYTKQHSIPQKFHKKTVLVLTGITSTTQLFVAIRKILLNSIRKALLKYMPL